MTEHDALPVPEPDGQPASRRLAEEHGYGREAVAFLGLSRLRGVGFHTLGRLGGRARVAKLLEGKDAAAMRSALVEAGARLGADDIGGDWDVVRRQMWAAGQELVWRLVEQQIRFLFSDDPAFPAIFGAMPATLRPQWLFIRGDLAVLSRPAVAVVGTRDHTVDGEWLARYAVAAAREVGAPVVSGLAKGIDRIAHEWCLRLGLPTISVLGNGILNPYPAKHAGLADEIVAAGGTVVSEYLPDAPPAAEQFVWRNRLQAALSRVVIPAEWKAKSGTAHTVRFARQMGRPVYGLGIVGVPRLVDAGEADRHFEVPREHPAFVEALRRALAARLSGSEPMRQPDLFGGKY